MGKDRFVGWWRICGKERSNKNEEFPGELVLDEEGFLLRLFGKPKEVDINLNTINEQEFIKVIIGLAKSEYDDKDYEFTLLNSYVSSCRLSSLYEIEIRAKGVIKGVALDKENPKFGEVFIRPTFMEEWLSVSGFDDNLWQLDEFNVGKFSTGVKYKMPEEIRLVKNDRVEGKICFSAKGPAFPIVRQAVINENAYLVFTFRYKKKVEDLIKFICCIQEFFSFVIGLPVRLEEVKVREHAYSQQKRKHLEYEPLSDLYLNLHQKTTNRKKVRSNSMLIPFKFMNENCKSLLERWLDTYVEITPAHRLYFGRLFSKNQYSENAFLDIVFSLEVLHRLIHKDFDGKHKKFNEKMEKIAKKLLKNDREWLMVRLGNKSSKTLLNRVHHIYQEYTDTFRLIFRDPEKAIKKIVTTRNFLVHYEVKDELMKNVIDSSRLYLYTNRLTIIYQTMLIHFLTGDKTIVNERIDKSTLNKIYIKYKYE